MESAIKLEQINRKSAQEEFNFYCHLFTLLLVHPHFALRFRFVIVCKSIPNLRSSAGVHFYRLQWSSDKGKWKAKQEVTGGRL